ncbi:MAG: hypothetical protein SNJ77_12010 [Cytophagales bacterium]
MMKFSFFNTLVGCIFLGLMASCSNPLDKKYNRETVEADFKRLVDLEKIDSSDASLMTEFMIKHELIDPSIIEYGASYRDILEEAKKYHQRLEKYAEIDFDEKENKRVTEEIRKSLRFVVVDSAKTYENNNLKVNLLIENTSNKTVKAMKCYIKVKDIFGKVIVSVPYSNYNVLRPGEIDDEHLTLNLNPNKSNQIISVDDPKVLKLDWQPMAILFEDDSMLEVSNHKNIKDEHEVQTGENHGNHKHKKHKEHEKH